MTFEDLDIEIEDDDGTGYRFGTLRYQNILVQFHVVQDTLLEEGGIVAISRIPPIIDDHWEEIKGLIIELAK